MIKIFSVIFTQSTVNPTALAAGISEALITTYAGLFVAIPVIDDASVSVSKSRRLR
jgi:biopolymer transport protein ExbB